MNNKTKILLLVLCTIAVIALLMWGRHLYGPTDETSAIEYVKSTLEYTAAEGELVYRKQVNAGCTDEFSGWFKTGRYCQYDGDAIYILNPDQARKLTSLNDRLISKNYQLTSENHFKHEKISDISKGDGSSISTSYYQKRGASQTVLVINLTSGKFLNSDKAEGSLVDIEDRSGRKIQDNQYTYEVSVKTSIPADMVEKK